jgi:hypothetical protein
MITNTATITSMKRTIMLMKLAMVIINKNTRTVMKGMATMNTSTVTITDTITTMHMLMITNMATHTIMGTGTVMSMATATITRRGSMTRSTRLILIAEFPRFALISPKNWPTCFLWKGTK